MKAHYSSTNRLNIESKTKPEYYLDDYGYKSWEDNDLRSLTKSTFQLYRLNINEDLITMMILKSQDYNNADICKIMGISLLLYKDRNKDLNKKIDKLRSPC